MATDSQTFKVDGMNYQERKILCGKDCKTCQAGGHTAYYKYTPASEVGALAQRGKWVYFGKRPPLPTGTETARCQCDGCENITHRLGQKYCSARCRVKAHRDATKAHQAERQVRL